MSYLLSERKEKHIGLGTMLAAIAFADPRRAGVYKRLWDILYKRSSRVSELQGEKWSEIGRIRNPGSHESRREISGASLERARHCTELCHEFLSILESPSVPPPSATRPGQPVPRR